MKRILLDKVKEALQSIGPVSLVILVVSLIFGVRGAELIEFIAGVLFLLLGLILFNIGAEASMMRIAEKIGTYITRKRKLWLLILVGFLIGFLVVIAEPNLWVLAEQFTAIPTKTLVAASALGVGIFLALTLLRIAFQIPFSTIVLIGYGIVFALGAVAPAEFLPASFDFGWVITGPLTVPFIIALGLGVASARGDSASEKDSFGLVGLIALGPIIAVLLLGLMHDPAAPSEAGAALGLWGYLLEYAKSIGIAILPFALFFFIFQIIAFKLPKKRVIRIVIGLVYTYIGLVLFLAGANVGFLSIGSYLGETIAGMDASWLLIPIGMLFGITIAVAEPSVTVLTKQVEEATSGTLPRKIMNAALSLGVSLAVGFSCLRVLSGISIWYILLPGYLLAFILSFFIPKIFTPIAFDSGASVTGVMTATFLIPFANAAAGKIEGANVLTDAFGLLSTVALTPILIVQILGLIYRFKTKKQTAEAGEDNIIELNEVNDETVGNHS
ncbi:MAG: DUF1538 domain-containing protein [Bacilli bacterium]